MRDLAEDDIARLLEVLGYRIPPAELSDVTWRVNALVERIRTFDELHLGDVEPWPVQPGVAVGGRE